ncbi:MAG TPA: HAMP domain-containing sensor histidine kinase [Myxococcaceae bacterium]|nr:HAMP domain-containing sensor histidine kinase [Myxococcaceae bacterium]
MAGQTSHREMSYAELERANEELRHALKGKSDLLSKMSHELRTPLNAVIGFSNLLLEGQHGGLSSQQQDFVTDIRNAGNHLLAVINDVLDLAKMEAGALPFELETLELEIPARQAEEMVRPLALSKGLLVEVSSAADVLCRGDLRRVRQIALNLFSNAIKFTPAGGRITAAVRKTNDGFAELAVSDTGVGIDPSDHALIFNEFNQVVPRGKNRQEGTGLGLSLVKRFAEQMGGAVGVQSQLGQGATFTVRFPALGVSP